MIMYCVTIVAQNNYDFSYSYDGGSELYYKITSDVEPFTVKVTYQYFSDKNNYSYITDIEIPESITRNGKTYAVTEIGAYAFCMSKNLTSVILPNTVTSIGTNAFVGCFALKTINIPESVESFGLNAFSNCSMLSSVTIPDLVTVLNNGVFNGCRSLTAIDIPESVTKIGEFVFADCESLTSIVIPNTVTEIGWEAFARCSKLKSITLPNPKISLNKDAFNDCDNIETIIFNTDSVGTLFSGRTSIKNVTIGDSVTSIVDKAFSGCSGLETIIISDFVKSIGEESFSDCSSLVSIIIPKSVKEIGDKAFSNCSSLSSIVIPDSVESINYYTFSDCSKLTTVTIPESVKEIDAGAFFGCVKLSSINIPDSISFIGNCAFYNCVSLDSISIPQSITSIDNSVFNGCSGLKSIIIPESVVSIGNYAFSNCQALTSLTIPNSVKNIDSGAFDNCRGLRSVTIGDSVITIGDDAFRNCSSLTSVIIPNSVSGIGLRAFGGCSSLESITLPFVGDKEHVATDTYQYPLGYIFGTDNYTNSTATTQFFYGYNTNSVSNLTYYLPTTLKNVVITRSNYLSYGAFYNCDKLASVSIPNTVKSIGNNVFSGCIGLTSATILCDVDFSKSGLYITKQDIKYHVLNKDSIEVEPDAYSGDVVIPETIEAGNSYTVISIGKAFVGRSDLSSVSIPKSVKSIENDAFKGCSNLTNVSISNSITNIGEGAFYGCDKLDYNSYDNAYYLGNDENPYLVLIMAKRDNIESCDINAKCKIIYGNAFYNCSNLSAISIPQSVISIGGYAFSGCTSLQRSEFASIHNLCSMNFYNSNANPLTYSNHLFINGKEITDLVISDTTVSIGQYTFNGCIGLTSISIPNSVSNIGNYAFNDCLNTRYLYYNSNANGDYFSTNSSIEKIVIGDSVSKINASTFSNCNKLKGLMSFAIVPPTLDGDPFPNADTIYVPITSVDAYKTATYWKRKEILPFGIVSAKSDNITFGTIYGDSILLDNNSITITALPKDGYHFTSWSDGNKDNPRIFTEAKNVSITALFEEHKIVVDSAVAATCTNYGLTEGSHCSVCGMVLVTQNETPMAEHTSVVDAAVAATATETGLTEGSHCSVCGAVIVAQEVIPALGEQGGDTPEPGTAVSESAANAVNIYAHGHTIVVENATDEIRVYDAMGRLVGKDDVHTVSTINVDKSGVCIVRIGNNAKRVFVNW